MSKLIIVGGSLATGKTTIAAALSNKTQITCVSMDVLKEHLFDVGGNRDRAWSKRIGHIAWQAFRQLIELHLEHHNDVIAEATFLWPGDADWIHEAAQTFGAELYQIWLTADPVVARERFIRRAQTERHPGHNDQVDHVMEEFDQKYFQHRFDPLPLKGETLVVDTTDFDAVDQEEICRFVG
ncbi:ATP-binding protein [Candidatus Uhrbacteria bacterium]|nr:ATP-binding protein [Candidatus Uhrbacteria bacterium]